jgi:hypothetical protein
MTLTTQRLESPKIGVTGTTAVEPAVTPNEHATKPLVAADSGLTSTPLPPAVSAGMTTKTGVLNAQVAAANAVVFSAEKTAIDAQRDKLKIISSDKAGKLAYDYLSLAKKAENQSPEFAAIARRAAASVMQQAVDKLGQYMKMLEETSSADSLASGNGPVETVLAGSGKAEYTFLGRSLRQLARGNDEPARFARTALDTFAAKLAESEERAWQKLGIAPGALSFETRVAARAAAAKATPDTVDGTLDIIKNAIADGDGRFAQTLITELWRNMPSLSNIDIFAIIDKKTPKAEIFANEHPECAFTYEEAKALQELTNALGVQAAAAARMQDLARREAGAKDTSEKAEWQLNDLDSKIAALQAASGIDPDYLDAAIATRDRIAVIADKGWQEIIDNVLAAFAKAPSLIEVETAAFNVCEDAWRTLAKRNALGAKTLENACKDGIPASQAVWDARIQALMVAPPAQALAAVDKDLSMMAYNFEKQTDIAGFDAYGPERAKIALDAADVALTALEKLPKEQQSQYAIDIAGFEAERYASAAKKPSDAARAAKLRERAQNLGLT